MKEIQPARTRQICSNKHPKLVYQDAEMKETNLRRRLRDVNSNGTARHALVSRAIQSRHRIPITAPRRDGIVAKGRCGQQVRINELAALAFLLTSIDAITGKIGFQIDGQIGRASCRERV